MSVQRVLFGLAPVVVQLPDACAPLAQEVGASSSSGRRSAPSDHQSESLPNELRRRNRSSQATRQPQSREEPHVLVLLWRPAFHEAIKWDRVREIVRE